MGFAMSDYSELNCCNKQKLVEDLKTVVADAEEILRATAGVAGEKMAELRERVSTRLNDAKLRLADAEAIVVDKTRAAARVTDEYVRENPWQAVGVAAGIGFLIGVMTTERSAAALAACVGRAGSAPEDFVAISRYFFFRQAKIAAVVAAVGRIATAVVGLVAGGVLYYFLEK